MVHRTQKHRDVQNKKKRLPVARNKVCSEVLVSYSRGWSQGNSLNKAGGKAFQRTWLAGKEQNAC